MRNAFTSEFAEQYGIDFLALNRKQRAEWRRAAHDKNVFGHTSQMPSPSFSLAEIHQAEDIIARLDY